MKSKKGLIIAIATVLVVALGVGLSFAAWDAIGASSNLKFNVGDNVTVTQVSTQNTADAQNLVPVSAEILKADSVNNTPLKKVGSFVPTLATKDANNASMFEMKYTVDGVYDASSTPVAITELFTVFVSIYADGTINDAKDGLSVDSIAVGDVLTSGTTYYVYIMFKHDLTSDVLKTASQYAKTAVGVTLGISATVVVTA